MRKIYVDITEAGLLHAKNDYAKMVHIHRCLLEKLGRTDAQNLVELVHHILQMAEEGFIA